MDLRNKFRPWVIQIILYFTLIIPTLTFAEDDENVFGVGMGPTYAGIGINYGKQNLHTLKYYSLGTYQLGYSGSNGLFYDFGVGYGIMTTKYSTNDKHGLGVNVGLSYAHRKYDEIGVSLKAGVNYNYFFNGMGNKGWNIGLFLSLDHHRSKFGYIGPISFGYQY